MPRLSDLIEMGALVDPDHGVVRLTSVTFASGGHAVDSSVVPTMLEVLFDRLDAEVEPAEFTKALLDVHPFRNGNVRVGWLVLNWLAGTLGNPVPLPDSTPADCLVRLEAAEDGLAQCPGLRGAAQRVAPAVSHRASAGLVMQLLTTTRYPFDPIPSGAQ